MATKHDFESLTKAATAAAFGVSVQALDGWLARGMPCVSKPGTGARAYRFSLPAVLRWRIDYERAQLEAATDETDLEEAKRRRAVAEAKLAEMEVATREGDLLRRDDVDMAVATSFAYCRAKLLALPTKLAPLAHGLEIPEIAEVARKIVYEALTELSETRVEDLTRDGPSNRNEAAISGSR
jgi:phage terminase Nu1 subunit (DNA packaging protein)